MIFADLIALAKAGYTPSDVREFLSTEAPKKEPEQGSEEAPEPKKTDYHVPDLEEIEPKSDPIPAEDPKNGTPEPSAHAIDYKKQYEEAAEALRKAQAANTRQELPKQADNDQIFKEAMAAFM